MPEIGTNGWMTKAEIDTLLDLRRVAHNAVDLDGNVKKFEDQLDDFAYGRMPSGDMFVISQDSASAGVIECPDLPIVMRQSIVRKIEVSHDLTLSDLRSIPKWLEDHPLALESLTEPNSLVVVADAIDHDGRDILVALHLEKSYRQVVVNDIGSIYGKNNLSYLVENTINAGREVFVNSRTGDWLQRTGVPFPERITNHLQGLLYQKSELPDGYTWQYSDDEPTRRLVAPDGEELVWDNFGTKEYQDVLHGTEWRYYEAPEDVPANWIAWEHHDRAAVTASTPNQPAQKRPKGKLPGPDRAAKHAKPAADQKAMTAAAKAQSAPTLKPNAKVVS